MNQKDIYSFSNLVVKRFPENANAIFYFLNSIQLLHTISEGLASAEISTLVVEQKSKYLYPISKILVRDFIFDNVFTGVMEEVSDNSLKELYNRLSNLVSSIISVCNQAGAKQDQEIKSFQEAERILNDFKTYVFSLDTQSKQ